MPDNTFKSVPTPDPNEMSFRVRASASSIFPSQIPKKFTPFKKCDRAINKSRVLQQKIGSYLYSSFTEEGDYLWFCFARPKTDEEKSTPFETQYEREFYHWPEILVSLSFLSADTIPFFGGDEWIITQKSRAAYDGLTRIKVEKFTSPTPFAPAAARSPQPGVISWNFGNTKGQTNECLHGRIRVPGTYWRGSATVSTSNFYAHTANYGTPPTGAGATTPLYGVGTYLIDATNETTWTDHVISDKQTFDQQSGVYYLERRTAIAPELGPLETKILGLEVVTSGIR